MINDTRQIEWFCEHYWNNTEEHGWKLPAPNHKKREKYESYAYHVTGFIMGSIGDYLKKGIGQYTK